MKKSLNRTPRCIIELKEEIAKLETEDTLTTKRVEREFRLQNIENFGAEQVYNELSFYATMMENLANAMYKREKELVERGYEQNNTSWSNVYNHSGSAYDDCADMIRKALTGIIRTENYRQTLINNLKK